jgi:hypothetical protein
MSSSQNMNDGSTFGTDVLVNAAVQATLISLQRELDDGATLEDIRVIVAGLLHYAQGKKVH